jgi:type IV pilus assembly protein PilV
MSQRLNFGSSDSRSKDSGFSLIEVLVALLVLSIGLLGLAMLQVESIKYNTDAYFRTQATILAYDIADLMRANRAVANAGGYAAAATPGDPNCGGPPSVSNVSCPDATQLASYDLFAWYVGLAVLPADPANGPSSIVSAGTQHTITIRWSERGVSKSRTWVIEL